MSAQVSGPPTLLIIPALRGRAVDGGIALTRKFIEGVHAYAQRWPGRIEILVDRTDEPTGNLDEMPVDPSTTAFNLGWLDADDGTLKQRIQRADLVLGSLVDRHVRLAHLCAQARIPLVYIAEYSVQTRQQIVRAETSNLLRRWRRLRYTTQLEARYRQAVTSAQGVQCNGTPTYEAYRRISSSPLLYFDTRTPEARVIETDALEERLRTLDDRACLRLAFSGRLAKMKGADALPGIGAALRDRGVSFTLDICGDGPLRQTIEEEIARLGLDQFVTMRGVLEFERELIPFISHDVDLFICPHRQGDPSCTYLETFACGVPIVGYANEAFEGLLQRCDAGWSAPLDDPIAVAERVAELASNRDAIKRASRTAATFARSNTFEETMDRRVDHLLACVDRAVLEAGA